MKKITHPTSPATLTLNAINAQARILRKHLNAFVKAQAKATEALRAINEIAMLENEGNPLRYPIAGTDTMVVIAYSTKASEADEVAHADRYLEIGDRLNDTLTEAQQALNASSHWASND